MNKQIPLFVLIVFLTIIIGVLPNTYSDLFSQWGKSYLGINYQKYFLGFTLVGAAILIYLSTNTFKKKTTDTDIKNFNVTDSTENRELLKQTQEEVSESKLGEAINILSRLNNRKINNYVTGLRQRLSKLRLDKIGGEITYDIENVEYNRISQSIIDLISDLEDELNFIDEAV